MKKLLLMVVSIISINAHAKVNPELRMRGLNFNAPTIDDKANVSDPKMGEIIYDTSDNAFYGNTDGSSSGWAALSSPSLNNIVTSDSDTILLHAVVTCSSSSSSGGAAWVTLGNIASGKCNLTFTSGAFASAPTCVTSASTNAANAVGANIQATSTTAGSISYTCSGSPCSSFAANVICVGARP
jgi:hypothetical protein